MDIKAHGRSLDSALGAFGGLRELHDWAGKQVAALEPFPDGDALTKATNRLYGEAYDTAQLMLIDKLSHGELYAILIDDDGAETRANPRQWYSLYEGGRIRWSSSEIVTRDGRVFDVLVFCALEQAKTETSFSRPEQTCAPGPRPDIETAIRQAIACGQHPPHTKRLTENESSDFSQL
jgi:hypothetical protein